jgi:hypothetical protein
MGKPLNTAMPRPVPGQKLLFVEKTVDGWRQGAVPREYEVEVASVGRKWATLKGRYGRLNIITGEMDGEGYSAPGRFYLSREHYEAEQRADRAWDAFRWRVGYQRPPGLAAERITLAASTLGIELPDACTR